MSLITVRRASNGVRRVGGMSRCLLIDDPRDVVLLMGVLHCYKKDKL